MEENVSVEKKQIPHSGQIEVKLTKKRFWRDPITLWWIRSDGKTKITPRRWSAHMKVAVARGILEIVNLEPNKKARRDGAIIRDNVTPKNPILIEEEIKNNESASIKFEKTITLKDKIKKTNIKIKNKVKIDE
jgi:hypothetical protein